MNSEAKQSYYAAALAAGACLLLLFRPGEAAAGVREGLALCGELVIPALFPFMALSVFLCESPSAAFFGRILSPFTRLLRLPEGSGALLLAAAVGGYPSSAKCIASAVLRGELRRAEAERMLTFCVNAGPPFLVAAVGSGIFGSVSTGFILLAAQSLSALVIAAVGALSAPRAARVPSLSFEGHPPLSVCVTRAVITASEACFRMCAFIVIFSAALALLKGSGVLALLPENKAADALLTGFFEVTAGCARAGALSGWAGPVTAAALSSFSGISVMFQIAGAVEGSGIRLGPFVLSRFFHGVLTALFCRLLLGLFPTAVESFSSLSEAKAAVSVSVPAFVSLLCMLSLFLLSLAPKNSKYSMENSSDI